ncbi:MAG: hypothetical protein CL587_13310 [Alteromonadaceae bacterium]|nr:hypothetical protein [Alteromonadaceae bacterium]
MLSDARDALQRVLNPVSYDDFFNSYVGKKPLIIKDNNPFRAAIGGTSPREKLLRGHRRYAPAVTCHSRAPKLPPPAATEVENEQAFYQLISDHFKRDYTVRIPDVTGLSPDLTNFTRLLEKLIQSPVSVVVFWSHQGAQAPVHHDEVDVIVIQLEGTKRWFISDAPPSFPTRWKKAGSLPPQMPHYQTVDVKAGDLIYLPRGTVHTVQSTSESIHLSIGFVPVTVRDTVNAVLDHLTEVSLPLRKDIGPRADCLASHNALEQVSQQVKEHLQSLLSAAQHDQFIMESLKRQRARLIQDMPKLTPSVTARHPVSVNTYVQRSPLAMAELVETDKILDLSVPGEQILIHPGVKAQLQFMITTSAFRVADIPGEIGDDVRVALTQRLLACGFLEPAPARQ